MWLIWCIKATSSELCKVYLCLLDSSSGLGVQPTGTRRKLSRRLSTVTEFMWTTWKLGAMPPLCFSLFANIQIKTQKRNVIKTYSLKEYDGACWERRTYQSNSCRGRPAHRPLLISKAYAKIFAPLPSASTSIRAWTSAREFQKM